MSKSCRCFWANEDGTCDIGEDPPIQETCAHQEEPHPLKIKADSQQEFQHSMGKTWRNKT
jgi:hypothetical protein